MKLQSDLLNEIEEIKVRLITIETALIKSETPTKEDLKDVREALAEYRKGKTTPYHS